MIVSIINLLAHGKISTMFLFFFFQIPISILRTNPLVFTYKINKWVVFLRIPHEWQNFSKYFSRYYVKENVLTTEKGEHNISIADGAVTPKLIFTNIKYKTIQFD